MAVMSMAERITGGVDTHLDVHVAAALDGVGGLLGVEVFPADAKGYRRLLGWLRGFGEVVVVGVEGTGSYGAGLMRHLHASGVRVVEVDRPNRQVRRRRGKSDPVDAIAAARAALSGDASVEPKTRTGDVESLRVLRIVRLSARKDRTRAVNQMRSLVSTAPEVIREDMRDLPIAALLERAAGFRPAGRTDVLGATKTALRMLARRALALGEEIRALDIILDPIVEELAPELLTRPGVGCEVAGALLVAAGDNPQRLRSEAGFANLCGVSPLDASSGKQQRHRLNRGGDRQANSALWRVVMTRMTCDPATKAYIARRTAEGLSKREAMRCLKRFVARELYRYLPQPAPA
ncbi:MAG TPA: IS110 family transposase [Acidimicrobiia bacterium]|jgi:transposase|nr:IS110 family transposase [Acidimicrobiia bacterium]